MVLLKTLAFGFFSTIVALPDFFAEPEISNIITRDIPRLGLEKRQFDHTIIRTYDHPTDPLLVRQDCNPCHDRSDCTKCGVLPVCT